MRLNDPALVERQYASEDGLAVRRDAQLRFEVAVVDAKQRRAGAHPLPDLAARHKDFEHQAGHGRANGDVFRLRLHDARGGHGLFERNPRR